MNAYIRGRQQMIDHHQARIERERSEIARLQSEIRIEQDRLDGPFVQVKYLEQPRSFGKTYCYRDPSGRCQIGDTVEVEAAGVIKLAIVEDLGRGSYRGSPIKSVLSILHKETL